MRRKVISSVVFWLSLFLAILVWRWIDESDLRRLSKVGIRTTGRIVELLPHQHQSVRYEFEAGGRRYVKLGGVSSIGKTPLNMSIGDIVPLYYRPDDPTVSWIGNPETSISPLRIKILGAFTFTAIVSLISLFFSLLPSKKNSIARLFLSLVAATIVALVAQSTSPTPEPFPGFDGRGRNAKKS